MLRIEKNMLCRMRARFLLMFETVLPNDMFQQCVCAGSQLVFGTKQHLNLTSGRKPNQSGTNLADRSFTRRNLDLCRDDPAQN